MTNEEYKIIHEVGGIAGYEQDLSEEDKELLKKSLEDNED